MRKYAVWALSVNVVIKCSSLMMVDYNLPFTQNSGRAVPDSLQPIVLVQAYFLSAIQQNNNT